jgi:hypothetical protein
VAVTGESKTHEVRGEFRSIAVDSVEGLTLRDGRVGVRGRSETVLIDMPASADTSRPSRQWVLVSEAEAGGKRIVSFTHEETVEDFTLELPASETTLRYGTFTGREGGDVMVFAWGSQSRSYWGYIIIKPR